ncbi:hypothetical protein bcgnr5385_39510 [Bacillus cereus]
MSDLLLLPDLKTTEPPQENESDMMFKVEQSNRLNVVLNVVLISCIGMTHESN